MQWCFAGAPLFTDATANLPQDPNLHSLDAEFGDFDKDGDLDVAVAVENGLNLLYVNNGAGKFTRTTPFQSTARDGEDLHVADFDKDGSLDLVLSTEEDQTHQFYLGNGNGTFRDVSSRIPWKCPGNALEAGDVDGDGYLDVAIGCVGQDLLLINDKQGGWKNETAQRLPALGEGTQDVKFGDLDGDGDLDLVIGNETPKNRLLINNGGVYADSAKNLPIPYVEETREVLLFDVDKDKDLDIVFCNITCNNCGRTDKNAQARLLINDGKGRFSDETATRMPKNAFSAWDGGYLDFDADGDLDLILCAIEVPVFSPLLFRAYRNDGKGKFTDATAEVMPPSAVGRGWDVEVADLDKDGTLDMFLGGWGTQARLLLGTVKQPVSLGKRPIHRLKKKSLRLMLLESRPGTWAFIPVVEGYAGPELMDVGGRALGTRPEY